MEQPENLSPGIDDPGGAYDEAETEVDRLRAELAAARYGYLGMTDEPQAWQNLVRELKSLGFPPNHAGLDIALRAWGSTRAAQAGYAADGVISRLRSELAERTAERDRALRDVDALWEDACSHNADHAEIANLRTELATRTAERDAAWGNHEK